MELGELAAVEQDPVKVLELVLEINRLLEAMQRRLRGQQQPETTPKKSA
jgi:hypothetical protein